MNLDDSMAIQSQIRNIEASLVGNWDQILRVKLKHAKLERRLVGLGTSPQHLIVSEHTDLNDWEVSSDNHILHFVIPCRLPEKVKSVVFRNPVCLSVFCMLTQCDFWL